MEIRIQVNLDFDWANSLRANAKIMTFKTKLITLHPTGLHLDSAFISYQYQSALIDKLNKFFDPLWPDSVSQTPKNSLF